VEHPAPLLLPRLLLPTNRHIHLQQAAGSSHLFSSISIHTPCIGIYLFFKYNPVRLDSNLYVY
jgi:hypothetical protein